MGVVKFYIQYSSMHNCSLTDIGSIDFSFLRIHIVCLHPTNFSNCILFTSLFWHQFELLLFKPMPGTTLLRDSCPQISTNAFSVYFACNITLQFAYTSTVSERKVLSFMLACPIIQMPSHLWWYSFYVKEMKRLKQRKGRMCQSSMNSFQVLEVIPEPNAS